PERWSARAKAEIVLRLLKAIPLLPVEGGRQDDRAPRGDGLVHKGRGVLRTHIPDPLPLTHRRVPRLPAAPSAWRPHRKARGSGPPRSIAGSRSAAPSTSPASYTARTAPPERARGAHAPWTLREKDGAERKLSPPPDPFETTVSFFRASSAPCVVNERVTVRRVRSKPRAIGTLKLLAIAGLLFVTNDGVGAHAQLLIDQ